jgi:hypothetical protein
MAFEGSANVAAQGQVNVCVLGAEQSSDSRQKCPGRDVDWLE